MGRRMKYQPIERTSAGYVVNLEQEEIDLLSRLFDELRGLLLNPDPQTTPLLRRLAPPAYHLNDDAEAEGEFQRLMHDDLVAARLEALNAVETLLRSGRPFDEDGAQALLRSLNSVRLVLGTLLDVGENDDPGAIPDDHPLVGELHLYHFLSYLLESTVQALGGA